MKLPVERLQLLACLRRECVCAVLTRLFLDNVFSRHEVNYSCSNMSTSSTIYARAFTFFRALSTIRVTCLRMRDKCKIINVQRNTKHFWYKYQRLFIRTYITFQQRYLSHINTRQISVEAQITRQWFTLTHNSDVNNKIC